MSGNEDKGEETVVTQEPQDVDDHSHNSIMEKDVEAEVEEAKNSEEASDMKPTGETQDLDENPQLDDGEQRELVIEECTEEEDRMVWNGKERKYKAWHRLVQLAQETD